MVIGPGVSLRYDGVGVSYGTGSCDRPLRSFKESETGSLGSVKFTTVPRDPEFVREPRDGVCPSQYDVCTGGLP